MIAYLAFVWLQYSSTMNSMCKFEEKWIVNNFLWQEQTIVRKGFAHWKFVYAIDESEISKLNAKCWDTSSFNLVEVIQFCEL